MISKKSFLVMLAAALCGVAALGVYDKAGATGKAETEAAAAAFTLPELPYAKDALKNVIDAETMEIHHGKHHKAYVDNLNKEVAKDKNLEGKTLEDIVANISKYNTATRNNAGGHWNHTFFWSLMSPEKSEPSPQFAEALKKSFGSMDEFKKQFEEAGTKQFGSGWVWLVVNDKGLLEITSTPNQDNPLMDVATVKGKPVLGNDVWEHAYYLKYQNKRADYLKSWWDVVNWTKVSEHYTSATAK